VVEQGAAAAAVAEGERLDRAVCAPGAVGCRLARGSRGCQVDAVVEAKLQAASGGRFDLEGAGSLGDCQLHSVLVVARGVDGEVAV
jgi:hypothetical protein